MPEKVLAATALLNLQRLIRSEQAAHEALERLAEKRRRG